MLRSLPSAIDDDLDTLYEPNAVFSQFLGSASMTFLFLVFVPFFSFFFSPTGLRLSCACVVIDTTCNIYVVVFLGWQAV